MNDDNADWEHELEDEFQENQDDSHRIIIDEDGVQVEHNAKEDVIEIKTGN